MVTGEGLGWISRPEKAREEALAAYAAAAEELRHGAEMLGESALTMNDRQRLLTDMKLGLMKAQVALGDLVKAEQELEALRVKMEGGWAQ